MTALFHNREDKALVAAVRARRQVLRIGSAYEGYRVQGRPMKVALHSRAQVGAKSEAELFRAVARAKGLV